MSKTEGEWSIVSAYCSGYSEQSSTGTIILSGFNSEELATNANKSISIMLNHMFTHSNSIVVKVKE